MARIRLLLPLAGLLLSAGVGPLSQPAGADVASQCQSMLRSGNRVFAGSHRVERRVVDGVKVNVLLPTGYATSGRRYPVLYLLAGATHDQDSWLTNSDVERFTDPFMGAQAAIVVMPAGELIGLNVDARNGRGRWETFDVHTLIAYIDSHYRTLNDRSRRAIAGLSGGAFSALHHAARHPDLYVASGSFSDAVDFSEKPPTLAYGLAPLGEMDVVCNGGSPTDAGVVGNPATDLVWFHDHNPSDLASNLGGVSVYLGAGDGTPCDQADRLEIAQDLSKGNPLTLIEPIVADATRHVNAAASAAHIPHTFDPYGCGIHSFRYFSRGLHTFWPQMSKAFGALPPSTFDYRTVDPTFQVWGWTFTADPQRAAEFLDISRAGHSGLTMVGSGTEKVTTGPLFHPGQRMTIAGASGRVQQVLVDGAGRLTFTIDLGKPHTLQQYTPAERVAEVSPNYFTRRSVQISASAMGSAQYPR